MADRKALLGLHNPRDFEAFSWMFESSGFSVDYANSMREMLDKMTQAEYEWYFMDANLGIEGGRDITPAKRIYELVKDRVKKGEARFLALSYSDGIVKKVEDEGIPAMDKSKFSYEMVE